MKVLANDGIAPSGKTALEAAGFTVITETVPQEDLINTINAEAYEVLLVRSATTVRKDLIDVCPGLKMIGRGGVGMDNIDVEYARSKGIEVFNTPAASSQSVAELIMAHLFGAVRFLYDSNRNMPKRGADEFKVLKKAYAKGIELQGKTMGIIGFGRIGKALAGYALGCGMNVIAHDRSGSDSIPVSIQIAGEEIEVPVKNNSLDEVIQTSDFISLHVPGGDGALIDAAAFSKMKKGVVLANAARGGVVDEDALLEALDQGIVAHAALDVFKNEPKPDSRLLSHPKISLSPHIGAATVEAQDRIGTELASNIIAFYESVKA